MMPADRPLRNLTREGLIGVYEELQTEPHSKKYNLRKELQTDRRENVVHANRWVTRDEYLELARQEILARGLDLPAVAGPVGTTSSSLEAPTEPAAESSGEPVVVPGPGP